MFSQSRLTAQGNQCNQSTCMLGLKLDKEMGKRIAKLTANTDKPSWTLTFSVQLWRSNSHSRLINKTPDAFTRGIKVALPSHIRQINISNTTDHLIKIHCQSLHPATGILKRTVTVILLLHEVQGWSFIVSLLALLNTGTRQLELCIQFPLITRFYFSLTVTIVKNKKTQQIFHSIFFFSCMGCCQRLSL